MRPVKWCAALALIWTFPLHAQEQPPKEQSALPWLELNSLSATRDRPLFAPSRRKAVPPPTALQRKPEEVREEVQQSRKPHLALTGIIASSSQSIAFLRDTSTSESIAVHSGETIGRWRVVITTDHSVKLQDGSDEVELEMFVEP
jgi:hypothetical protein